MKPLTVQDALNLPALYDIPRDIGLELDYYGPYLRQCYLQAYVNFEYNSYYVANVAVMVLYGAVGFLLLTAMAIRLFNNTTSNRRLPPSVVRVQTFLVKHLYLSSGVGTKSLEPVQWLGRHASWATIQIPLRVHSIIIFIYVTYNLVIIFTPYKALIPSLYWQEIGYPALQYIRFFADRTGIMSFGSTPLTILLAGRNSPISFVTGASFSTLQMYHRWVARVTFCQALFHGIAYTVEEYFSNSLTENYLAEAYHDAYWNWGCVALGGGALLCAGSFRKLRELAYEVFLIGHIVGGILWIAGCYYHVYLLDPKYYFLKWIYAAVALWSFDRSARGLRMLYLNLPSFRLRSSSSNKHHFVADGCLVGNGDFLRLRVTMARAWPESFGGPGTYVFISSPTHNVWESHPFTITWPTGMPAPSTPASSPSAESSDDPESPKLNFAGPDIHPFEVDDEGLNRTFELVLKAQGGFTRKLAKSLAIPEESSAVSQFKLLVEGPYGSSAHVHSFESVLLVAGGSGISATIAHLADLAKRAAKGPLEVKRIVVVWTVRDLDSLHVLLPYVLLPYVLRLQHLLSSSTPHPFLRLAIYHTGDSPTPSSSSSQDAEKKPSLTSSHLWRVHTLFKPLPPAFLHLSTHEGRPLVSHHLDALGEFVAGRIAVSACGPGGLCDAARVAVRDRLGAEGFDARTLVYSEEAFTW